MIGKTKFSLTTFELWKSIAMLVTGILVFNGFMFNWFIPKYESINRIPIIEAKVDTVIINQDKLFDFQAKTEIRHKQEDSIRVQ